MIPHPLTCLSLLYYSTLLYSTRRGTRYLRAPPAVGSSAGRPGSSCPSASARSTISSSRSRSTRWLHTPAAPWLHARPPGARAHPPECPPRPQLPSPTLGPTPTRATPSVSFRSSKTRAPPRSKPPPPARRSSPARALPPSSSASSPATPRPRCGHIGLQPLHIGLQPLLHRVTASVTTPRPRRCSSKSV